MALNPKLTKHTTESHNHHQILNSAMGMNFDIQNMEMVGGLRDTQKAKGCHGLLVDRCLSVQERSQVPLKRVR